MHFILLVYKYEYIMNKSSYFVDFLWYCVVCSSMKGHLKVWFVRIVNLSKTEALGKRTTQPFNPKRTTTETKQCFFFCIFSGHHSRGYDGGVLGAITTDRTYKCEELLLFIFNWHRTMIIVYSFWTGKVKAYIWLLPISTFLKNNVWTFNLLNNHIKAIKRGVSN